MINIQMHAKFSLYSDTSLDLYTTCRMTSKNTGTEILTSIG